MKVVIQRVSEASVAIVNEETRSIGIGFLILLGIGPEDNQTDIDWLCQKIAGLRVFDDENGVMNLNINQIDGGILLISQFTLMASTKKGNRPSYINAAHPDIAIPLYKAFIQKLESTFSKKIVTGTFGADMKVSLTNDGPVTITIDSKNRV